MATGGAAAPLETLGAAHTAVATDAFTDRLRAPQLARDTDRREIAASAFSEPAPAPAAPPVAAAVWTLSAWDIAIPQWRSRTAEPGATPVLDKRNDAWLCRTVTVPRSKATA